MALVLQPEPCPATAVQQEAKVTREADHPLLAELTWSLRSPSSDSETSEVARQPLLIFDWDDTLLPTTALTLEGHMAPLPVAAEARQAAERQRQILLALRREELNACAESAARVLRAAKCVGQVVIITNAIQGWVQNTCTKFMPDLLEELEDVTVISARSIFEPQGIPEPARWKERCFNRVAESFLEGSEGPGHVVSIGDSWHERAAVMELAQDPKLWCHVKSLKLADRPAFEQVGQQLELVSQCLEQVASHEGHLDLAIGEGMVLGPLSLDHWFPAAAKVATEEAPVASELEAETPVDEEQDEAEEGSEATGEDEAMLQAPVPREPAAPACGAAAAGGRRHSEARRLRKQRGHVKMTRKSLAFLKGGKSRLWSCMPRSASKA